MLGPLHRAMFVIASIATLAALVAAACSSGPFADQSGSGGSTGAPTSSASATSPPSSPSTSTQTSPSGPSAAALRAAAGIRSLTASLGSGGVSVAAVRTDTGASFRYGATGGMATGSIAKLFILETLLLQRQDAGETLSAGERDAAQRMIENSDNAAADELYGIVGTVAGLNRAGKRLGVRNTQPGTDYLWGFTETCATDYVALLRDLVGPSALSPASRRFALGLMANIESDQRWGVSAAADAHTTVRLKNGWLPSDPDGGRWLVNSVGIVTVDGHQVLLAVMTQHGSSFDGGITLVEKIARLAAHVVA